MKKFEHFLRFLMSAGGARFQHLAIATIPAVMGTGKATIPAGHIFKRTFCSFVNKVFSSRYVKNPKNPKFSFTGKILDLNCHSGDSSLIFPPSVLLRTSLPMAAVFVFPEFRLFFGFFIRFL